MGKIHVPHRIVTRDSTACPECGRPKCGKLSTWRWSYDPIFWRKWERYGDGSRVMGYRFGPIVVWRFRYMCRAQHGARVVMRTEEGE